MGLAEIDDGDALAVVEHVGLGARVPTFGLVTEVDAGIEEVFGSYVHGIYVICLKHRSADGPPCDREMSVMVLLTFFREKESESTGSLAGTGKRRINFFLKRPLTGVLVQRCSGPPTYCRVEQPGSSSGS